MLKILLQCDICGAEEQRDIDASVARNEILTDPSTRRTVCLCDECLAVYNKLRKEVAEEAEKKLEQFLRCAFRVESC